MMAIEPHTPKWKRLSITPEASLNEIEEKIIDIPISLEKRWSVSAGFSVGDIFFKTCLLTVG
jgi:hypothetical protein